jgi:hypothetical protein
MLTAEELGDLEGDAGAMLRLAGLDDDAPPSMDDLAVRLLGHAPQRAPRRAIRGEGALARIGDDWRVYVAADVTAERARWVVGHELAHWWHRVHIRAPESERRCDALGAMLAAPRRAMLRAVRLEGHAVTRLAVRLRVPQALALLRLGEIVERPVALVRPAPIARGGPFPWPENLGSARRLPGAHPIRVDGGLGWMAAAA